MSNNEDLYWPLFDHNPQPMWVYDRVNLAFLEVNEAAIRHYGYSRTEYLSMTIADIDVTGEDPCIAETFQGLHEAEPLPLTRRQRKKDGSVMDVEFITRNLEFAGCAACLVLVQDVTNRQRAEEKILHLNRVYAVLSEINQTITRLHDPQTLYNETCRIAVETGKLRSAWIGLIEESTGEVRLAAHAGAMDGYLDGVPVFLKARTAHVGPIAVALDESRHVVCNDTEHDPSFAPWREAAMRRCFRSVAVFPLKSGGLVFGAFALYSGVSGFFDRDEVRLLDQLASDISFATEAMENEQRRKQAEEGKAESEARFSSAFQYAAVGMALVAPDGRWLKVNGALCELLGYSEEALLCRSFQELTHPDDLQEDLEQVRRMLAGEIKTYRMEKRYLHASGDVVWALLGVSLVRDKRGVPLYFISQLQDITARKHTEDALRKSEQEQRLIAVQLERALSSDPGAEGGKRW